MQIPSRGYYPSSPRNMYLRLCKWKLPPNTKSSRQCECGRKKPFYCRGCFWVGAEDEVKSYLRMTFFFFFLSWDVLRNWMNHRCWIEKRDANFLSLLCLHSIPFLMQLSGRRRDTTPKINTDAFYMYSRFLQLFLSAALAINPHWPQVWCSINTTTHAQTRTRVAGSIGGCFQTSFLSF